MLLGNYSILNKNPHKLLSSLGNLNSGSYWQPSACRGLYTSQADGGRLQNACVPTGTEPPYVFMFAPKGGELSSTTHVRGESSISSSLILGRVMEANLSGSGDITSSLSLITSLAAALSGTGTITASMSTTLSLAANLAGSGDLSGALALLVTLTSNLSGSGTMTSDLKGNLDMEADIYVNQSEATVQQIVDAVWSAVAADYNASGTMGQKLNGAGSAGDPWTTDLSAYTTVGTAGALMKKAAKPKISL
jgi:hypothetical protein